jgi:hypothetical protein
VSRCRKLGPRPRLTIRVYRTLIARRAGPNRYVLPISSIVDW